MQKNISIVQEFLNKLASVCDDEYQVLLQGIAEYFAEFHELSKTQRKILHVSSRKSKIVEPTEVKLFKSEEKIREKEIPPALLKEFLEELAVLIFKYSEKL